MPELGDFGVVRTGGWAGALIRFGTRSRVNHAFVYIGRDRIVEAEPHGARIAFTDEYSDISWSNLPLTAVQRSTIANLAEALGGTPYNWLDIAALAIRSRGISIPFANRRIERVDRLICSQLVDKAYEFAGVHLFNDDRLPGEVTPGDLLDIIEGKPVPQYW